MPVDPRSQREGSIFVRDSAGPNDFFENNLPRNSETNTSQLVRGSMMFSSNDVTQVTGLGAIEEDNMDRLSTR